MWATGSNALTTVPMRKAAVGFTLVELLAAITIVGMLLAFAVPASVKFFESMQYRQAVREVITVLGSARHAAIDKGTYQDVVIHPAGRRLTFNGRKTQLPKEVQLAVHSAREVNRDSAGVIRFYPEGGSSGGSIDIERPGADGVRISVDWLAGRVTQERYATE